MLSPQLNALQLEDFAIDENQGYNYGNYFRVLTDPAKALSNGSTGEIGWGGFGGTYFFVDPSEELTVIYMQQIEGGYDSSFIRGVRQIVYGAI